MARRILIVEEPVVQPDLGINCMFSRDPVQSAFDLAFSKRTTAARPGIIGAVDFCYFTGVILFKALASDDICSLKPYLLSGLSLIHISEPTRRTPISYA